MKLKYILFSLCLLGGLMSCASETELNSLKNNTSESKTRLSLRLFSQANPVTKADGLDGESNINNLTAFVFNAETNELVSITSDPAVNAQYECEMLDIEAGPFPIRLVLISNAPLDVLQAIRSYQELDNTLALLSDQKRTNLTMSSAMLTTISPLFEGDNYIGFEEKYNVDEMDDPILITRLAARLDISLIETRFTRQELAGRAVTIHSVQYDKIKTASSFFSIGEWGAVGIDGHWGQTALIPTSYVITNDRPVTGIENEFNHYVMENLTPATGDETSILVHATLEGNDEYQAETRVFRAIINANGIQNGYDHNLIRRNYVYRLSLTLADNSFTGIPVEPENPDPVDPEPENPNPEPEPEPEPEIPTPEPEDDKLVIKVTVLPMEEEPGEEGIWD